MVNLVVSNNNIIMNLMHFMSLPLIVPSQKFNISFSRLLQE